MGYIREPKNIDLVVGPSVLTEETKHKIELAIAQYKKSGQKPVSVKFVTQGSAKMNTQVVRVKHATAEAGTTTRKKAKF